MSRTYRTGRSLLAAAATVATGLAQEPARPEVGRLRNVEIRTRDVFAEEQAAGNLLYRTANFLHFTTHEEVVRREIWLQPGDPITQAQAMELERNLRRLDLFGGVETRLVDAGGGATDLIVDTRDRFTLAVGGGVSRVGGVVEVKGRLAEGNLFGTGKQVVVVSNQQEGEFTKYLRYTDPQLFGSWHTLETSIGETEEGTFVNVDVVRPLRNLDDPWTYGVGFHAVKEDVDYRRFGESTAEVPRRQQEVQVFAANATGPRELRRTLGLDLRLRSAEYGDAFGPEAPRWRVPNATDVIELGPTFGFDYLPRFDRVQRLDATDYVEDLPLGVSARARVAGSWRDEVGAGADLRPLLDCGLQAAANPVADTYLTLELHGRARLGNDHLLGWRNSAALHVFQLSLPAQTLAASLTYDAAYESEDLPVQLTLGEDNGLRGYPAFEFAGSRFARCNLEDRIDTGLQLWSVHLGVCAFYDIGWVHDPVVGLSMRDPIRGAGFGLRLGSSELLGAHVVRIDFAWPLDDVDGETYSTSLSFGAGQVFTFFGNAAELGSGS